MLFDEPSREPLPIGVTFEDHRTAAIKGLLGSIPVLGGVLAEEMGLLIAPPLAERRDAWFGDLARRLRELEMKVGDFHFDDLGKNEQFVSATVQATQAALRTHQRAKLDALRNAVLNVAAGHETDTDRQTHFIAMVNRFSETHLTLLRFFDDPAGHFKRRDLAPPQTSPHAELLVSDLVFAGLPELRTHLQSPAPDRTAARIQMLQVLIEELRDARLISLARVKDNEAFVVPRFVGSAPYPLTSVITDLGKDFLGFVSEPQVA